MTSDQQSSTIVVGVDGSPSSQDAVRWAARQARLVDVELHAVISWALPIADSWGAVVVDYDWAGNARSVLARALDEALGAAEAGRVHQHVVEGHPAHALLHAAAAAAAELLVVGSRGHGGFSGMLLGSVSQHVIAHAPCPVVVVRHDAAPIARARGGGTQTSARAEAPVARLPSPTACARGGR
jgi:nucleotide-binding universal stress UspA family protein